MLAFKNSKKNISVLILVFLFIAVYFSFNAFYLKFNVNPDELMRFLVPNYIYRYGHLPTGFNKGAVYFLGNWSYAFYPQLLGAMFSSLFMRICSFWTTNQQALLFAARFTSVLFGLISVTFVGLTIMRITHDIKLTIMGMLTIAFWPQFTYLSSYINNDIIATAGVSMIMYALMTESSVNEWNRSNVVILIVGSIICCLGYLNSVCFVLTSGLYFIVSLYFWNKPENKITTHKNTLLAFYCLVTFLIVAPLYIRNAIIYHGDFFGTATFHKQYLLWLHHGGKVLQFPFENQGGVMALLLNKDFWKTTVKSFIGYFGYMSIPMNRLFYFLYSFIILIGIIGLFFKKARCTCYKFRNVIITLCVGATGVIFCFFITLYLWITNRKVDMLSVVCHS